MNRYKILSQLTTAQHEELVKNGSANNRDKDHFPVVKFFLAGTGFTWLLTEIDPMDTNIAFGLCDLGMGFPELGYVDLDELGQAFPPFYNFVESDRHFQAKYPISIYADAARSAEMITDNPELLMAAFEKRKNRCKPE